MGEKNVYTYTGPTNTSTLIGVAYAALSRGRDSDVMDAENGQWHVWQHDANCVARHLLVVVV